MISRRLFLASASALALQTPLTKALAQTTTSPFVITRNTSGAIVRPEMFGVNLLAPDDAIGSGFLAQRNAVNIRSILRWPGGTLTEGTLNELGDWVANTGVDYGDLDQSGLPAGTPNVPGSWYGTYNRDTGRLRKTALATQLVPFLQFCRTNAFQPVIVLPSFRFLFPKSNGGDRVRYGMLTGTGPRTLRSIVHRVLALINQHAAGLNVYAWEIGNEYSVTGASHVTQPPMTAAEYARLAEHACRVIRSIQPGARVAVQNGPLTGNTTTFATQANALHQAYVTQANLPASSNLPRLQFPDYTVQHFYQQWDDGFVRAATMSNHAWTLWNKPQLVTEWNCQQARPVSRYNSTELNYRAGMEHATRIGTIFDALVSNQTEGATIWPVNQRGGRYTALFQGTSGSTTNQPMIGGRMFRQLSGIWDGNGNANRMRVATIQAPAGSPIWVRAYCREDGRMAKVFIYRRTSPDQTLQVRVHNMANNNLPTSVSCVKLSGPSGPIDLVANPAAPEAAETSVTVSHVSASNGRLFNVPIQNSMATRRNYEVYVLTVRY